MRPFKKELPCKGLACKILAGSGLVILIPFIIFIILLRHYDHKWMEYELRSQARSICRLIIVTRQWISWHGGIYIKDEKNDFKLLTPSHFVRDLTSFSRISQALPYQIKIAVKNPKSPEHQPDEFEKMAIELLKNRNKNEVWKIEKDIYRYAAPLTFRGECLSCHKIPGKEPVAGCISISLKADKIKEYLAERRKLINIFFILTFIAMIMSLSFLINKLVLNPLNIFKKATEKIKEGKQEEVKIETNGE